MKLPYIPFFVSIILVVSCGITTKVNTNQGQRSVSVVLPDKNIEARVYPDKRIKPKLTKYYHWYGGQSINVTQGGYSGSLLDGVYSEYSYPGKLLICKGHYKNGLKQGLWLLWYTDGQLKSTEKWKNGWLHGDRCIYNDSGSIIKKERYKKGNLINSSADTVIKRKGLIKRLQNCCHKLKKSNKVDAKPAK